MALPRLRREWHHYGVVHGRCPAPGSDPPPCVVRPRAVMRNMAAPGRPAGCPKGNLQACVRGRVNAGRPRGRTRGTTRNVPRDVLQAAGRRRRRVNCSASPMSSASRLPHSSLADGRRAPCPLGDPDGTSRASPARPAGRAAPSAGRPAAAAPADLHEPLRADTPLQVPLRGTCRRPAPQRPAAAARSATRPPLT